MSLFPHWLQTLCFGVGLFWITLFTLSATWFAAEVARHFWKLRPRRCLICLAWTNRGFRFCNHCLLVVARMAYHSELLQ